MSKIEEAFRGLGRTEKVRFISQNIEYANAVAVASYVKGYLFDVLNDVGDDEYIAAYLREKGYEVKKQEYSSNRYINKRIMNERTIQIDVIGKIEGTQFMKCKLYTNENIVIIMMNEFDYERLKEEGIFIRDGKSRDSAGVLNTTNTFIEKN